MVQYDPMIIYKFADRLYSTAKIIIVAYTFIGLLVGGAIGGLGGYALEGWDRGLLGAMVGMTVMLGLVFSLIGFFVGREKAYRLWLQAQTALCQVKIEENTGK